MQLLSGAAAKFPRNSPLFGHPDWGRMPELMSSSPTPRHADQLHLWLHRPLIGLFIVANGLFLLWLCNERLWHPFELEWMEGAMRDHVARVLAGEALYVAPSFEHVCFLYHPLFFYLAGLFGLVLGEGYVALRLVSLLASLATLFFVFRLVRRDGSREGAWLAVGLCLAGFSLTGCYADVGRIDPLFCGLLLAGVDTLRAAGSRRALWAAGTLFVLAWLTKQTALVILPLVVFGYAALGWRRAGLFGLAVAAASGLSVWLLDLLHDGWFFFYTVELPRTHGILPQAWLGYWTQDVLPLLAALVLGVLGLWRGGAPRRPVLWFHAAWILAAILGSYGSRLHIGGAENVLFPMLGAVAVLFGLGVSRLLLLGGWATTLTSGFALLQLVFLFALPWLGYPIPQVPDPVETRRAQVLLDAWRQDDVPRYLPWHGALSRELGLGPMAHKMAMDDVWRSGNEEVIATMNAALRAGLAARPGLRVQIDYPDPRIIPNLAALLQDWVPELLNKELRWPAPVVGSDRLQQPQVEMRRQ